MAIVFVQHDAQNWDVDALAFTGNVTSGNWLVAVCAGDTANPSAVGSDRSAGFVKAVGAAGNAAPSIWYAKATSTGACTVTVTPDTLTGYLALFEVSGLHATTPLDVTNTASGTGANPSVTKTTVADNDAVIALVIAQTNITGITAGYTQKVSNPHVAVFYSDAYHTDVGTAGSKTLTYTATAGVWNLAFAAFQPPATSALVGQICL